MRVLCPTCRGKGKIRDPNDLECVIECQTCAGGIKKTGWIDTEQLPADYDQVVEGLRLKDTNPTGSMKANL